MRTRYTNLFRLIEENKPKSILEIGTYDARNAHAMISHAKKFNTDIEYYGFDLFEEITPEMIKKENSKKKIVHFIGANNLLASLKIKYGLYCGFTKDTLPKFDRKIDFIFVDGGHSEETIHNDWENVQRFMKPTSVVIFDDFYLNNAYPGFGCYSLRKEIDPMKFEITLLTPIDTTIAGYPVQMMLVKPTILY